MKDALAISESGSNEGPRFGGGLRLSSVVHAPVAQWIEHRPPEPKVAGSNPVGRVRTCRLGPRRLDEETGWIERYRRLWDARFDELERVVEEQQRKDKVDGRDETE